MDGHFGLDLPDWVGRATPSFQWTVIGIVLAIGTSPLWMSVVGYFRDRDQHQAQHRATELAERAQDAERNDFNFEQLRAINGDLGRRIAELQEEVRFLRANRDRGWNLLRGMEKRAHVLWHMANNLVFERNMLLLTVRRFVASDCSLEHLTGYIGTLVEMQGPPPLPPAEDVEEVPPPPLPAPQLQIR